MNPHPSDSSHLGAGRAQRLVARVLVSGLLLLLLLLPLQPGHGRRAHTAQHGHGRRAHTAQHGLLLPGCLLHLLRSVRCLLLLLHLGSQSGANPPEHSLLDCLAADLW